MIKEANTIFLKNFGNSIWFGRCIFISWYCDIGTCKFCYRATQHSRIQHAENARRGIGSILAEVIFAKKFGWHIEFLTGGYRIYPIDELVRIAEIVSRVYGEKIWLNLGALSEDELKKFLPYIKGVVASIETVNSEIHDKICPDKAIQPYENFLKLADKYSLKKSITIIIGLGETARDFPLLENFIKKHKLDRITFYALKPIKGTPYEKGPDSEYYAEWIAKTRIKFPKLEIIAGTTARRVKEAGLLLRAGANAITKFPALKLFGTEKAQLLEQGIKGSGRHFTGTLTEIDRLNEFDPAEEVSKYDFLTHGQKQQTIQNLKQYLKRIKLNLNKCPKEKLERLAGKS